MGVIKFDRDFSTLFNWDSDENPTTEQDYQNAVKNWTETEMNIVDTLLWQPTTEYATGNIVKTPSLPSQYVLRCTEAGTSGSTEPSYSGAGAGDTVTDGTVEWVIVSLATGNAADVDASNIGVNAEVDNSEAWASAIGGGAIAEDDGRLVTGDTVHAVTSVMETNIATNTEAIEDNTEAIATNTANITQNATDIDIADKRISNIEKLLQGNLYDYQTDTSSAYTKTVLAGAMPYASLDSIGGKTLVWNQLNNNSNATSTESDITFTNNGDGSWTINGTATADDNKVLSVMTRIVNHQYYVCGCPSGGSATTYNFGFNGAYTDIGGGGVATSNNTTGNIRFNFHNGNTFSNVTIYPKVVDLTLEFGAGNEPTAEEFNAMFPNFINSNISYNAGQLLSAGVTEVKSVGKNLADQDVIFGAVWGATKTNEGWQCGTSPLFTKYRNDYSTNDFPAIYSQSASLSFDVKLASADTGKVLYAGFVDNENTRIAETINLTTNWQHITKTQTTTASARKVYFSYNNNTTVIIKNFQVEVGTTATTYSPYHAPISTPIPAEIQALEGYGWSAGSVYNYIDYERKMFVQRVGSIIVDGNSNVSHNGTTSTTSNFILAVTGKAYGATNFISDLFLTGNYGTMSALGRANSDRIEFYLPVSVPNTDADGKAWFTSNPTTVYYELATPIETDISAYLTDDNLVEVESGGTLTFPNSNGDDYRIDVPSSETYMVDLQASL